MNSNQIKHKVWCQYESTKKKTFLVFERKHEVGKVREDTSRNRKKKIQTKTTQKIKRKILQTRLIINASTQKIW